MTEVEIVQLSPFTSFTDCMQYSRKVRSSSKLGVMLRKKIAILGGVTTSHILITLDAYLLQNGIDAEFYESEYALYEQAVLSRDVVLTSFEPDLIIFITCTENIRNRPVLADSSDDVTRKLEIETKRWVDLLTMCSDNWVAPIIFSTFTMPDQRVFGNYELKFRQSMIQFVRDLNLNILQTLTGRVSFLDAEYLSSYMGLRNWNNPAYWNNSKHHLDFESLPFFCYHLGQQVSGLYGKYRKCLVLDLDNTVWGGVIGDDGIENIKIGEGDPESEAYLRFQEYLVSLHDRGVLLAVCSKNDDSMARKPFKEHDGMKLKLKHISCFVANWESKAENVVQIAESLNIGLDALVFFDDNPFERENVSQFVPEVKVVNVPEDPSYYIRALDELALFDAPEMSSEDLSRTEMYHANHKRERTQSLHGNYESFLESLNMRATVASFDDANLPRITQLINKTNQFNLTTLRYTESEVMQVVNEEQSLSLYVKLKDKYGDNGLISVFHGVCSGEEMSINLWLMSCRVLKRGVEDLLMNHVVEEASARGIQRIVGEYVPTQKNAMVKDFYARYSFKEISRSENGEVRWELNVSDYISKDVAIDLEP